MNNNEKYIDGIKKTGFILEYNVSQILRDSKWSVISNKYYEDDLLESVREIDIIAYKAVKKDDIWFYTVLLISCKKSEENAWVLISRDINLNEPNLDRFPLHAWSNDAALLNVMKNNSFNKDYYTFMNSHSNNSVMNEPEVDVFAFQEMNKITGKPHNDKNIFTSITTLMKAQAYEIGALSSRKKEKCIYQFNLISLVDSDIIRLKVSPDNIFQESIDTEQMVARYIVNKKEQFFRLRFLTAEYFKSYVLYYNELHSNNYKFFLKCRREWLKDSIKDSHKVKSMSQDFFKKLENSIYKVLETKLFLTNYYKDSLLFWEEGKSSLRIYVVGNESQVKKLNESEELILETQKLLYENFGFEGSFFYSSDDLPF